MIIINLKTLLKLIKNPNKKYNKINFIQNKNYIIKLFFLSNLFTKFYILCLILFKKNKTFILLNTNIFFHSWIQHVNKLTKTLFISPIWKKGIFTNWNWFKKNIILLRWLIFFFYFCFIKKINISKKIKIKFFNLFLKLKKLFFGFIIENKLPDFFLLFTFNTDIEIIKEILKKKKNIITTGLNSYFNSVCYYYIYNTPTFINNKLILYLFTLSWIQAKL